MKKISTCLLAVASVAAAAHAAHATPVVRGAAPQLTGEKAPAIAHATLQQMLGTGKALLKKDTVTVNQTTFIHPGDQLKGNLEMYINGAKAVSPYAAYFTPTTSPDQQWTGFTIVVRDLRPGAAYLFVCHASDNTMTGQWQEAVFRYTLFGAAPGTQAQGEVKTDKQQVTIALTPDGTPQAKMLKVEFPNAGDYPPNTHIVFSGCDVSVVS